MTVKTGEVRMISDQAGPHFPGTWFSSGNTDHLLLESNFDIGFYSFETDRLKLLDETGTKEGNPHRSQDGSWIAYESDRSGDYDVWLMKSDGSEPQNLTNHPAFDWYPRWRPTR